MAGNKFDTQFSKNKVEEVKLLYKGLYGDEVTFTGDIKAVVKHLMNLI